MHTERRHRRSDAPAEATRLFLSSLAARIRARSIVLADTDGLLVAGVGDEDLETLAALGAAAAPGTHAAELIVGGVPLRLFAVGGEAPPVANASEALNRILAA